MMKMIDKLKTYYEMELQSLDNARKLGFADQHADWYAIQRCMGAGSLAQMLGASYQEVENLFEEYKEKFEKTS